MQTAKVRIPQNISELSDLLISMLLSAPSFTDNTGWLPFVNLQYVFSQLNKGLDYNRQTIGEEHYQELMQMSDRMRALFEADPDDKTGETLEGCKIIHEMEDILKQVRRKS
jgi:hypothetical protein